MGQHRTDTYVQRQAKAQVAEHRRCPRCQRKSALSSRYELRDDYNRRIGSERECNYCGHRVGIVRGETYGRDVEPEPGARGE